MSDHVYRLLYRIRRVEEEIARVYPTDKIMSPVHLSIGQEAVSVGVCGALRPEDVVFGSYRCHALYIAKGGNLNRMIAELYGKQTGCAKGKAGSMHLIDTHAGVMGASAVVGTTIPLAAGYALAAQMQGKDFIVASFFGDGAVEEGVFHETLNFANLKKLPVVFICENNSFAIHSRQFQRQSNMGIIELARAHNIPAERLDSRDVYGIIERVTAAVEEIRVGRSGPRFFEMLCYRWMEHVGPNTDFDAGYRAREEADAWMVADPVKIAGQKLTEAVRRSIESEEEKRIQEAFAFAEQSRFPDDSELYSDMSQDE